MATEPIPPISKTKLEGYLRVFDSLNLVDESVRRLAPKALYDYFQILLYEVAWRYCGQDKNCFRNQGLEARWNMLNNVDSLFEEDLEKWKHIIKQMQNLRVKVEHNDEFIPDRIVLEDLRHSIPQFTEWLLASGTNYYKKSRNFSFVEEYLRISQWYLGEADSIILQYEETVPFFAKIAIETEEYRTLESLREKIAGRILEINVIKDLKKEDLENLSKLIKRVERFAAQITTLLNLNVCPKCGGKIAESHTYVLGINSTKPVADVRRIGCGKCDFIVETETIDLWKIRKKN